MGVLSCFTCSSCRHVDVPALAEPGPQVGVAATSEAATQTTEYFPPLKVDYNEGRSLGEDEAKVPAVRSALELEEIELAHTEAKRLSEARASDTSTSYNAVYEPQPNDSSAVASLHGSSALPLQLSAGSQQAQGPDAENEAQSAVDAESSIESDHELTEAERVKIRARDRNAALRSVFLEFARFGTRTDATQIDVFRFMKLCRECCLLASPTDASSIGLVFYKCKAIRSHKMTYSEFKTALGHIAVLLGVDKEAIVDAIVASQGPLANNITLPKYVRCHDDRDGWTGTQRVSSVGSIDLLATTSRPATAPSIATPRTEKGLRATSLLRPSSPDPGACLSSRYGDLAPRSMPVLPGIAERRTGTYPSHFVRSCAQEGDSSGFVPTSARPGSPRGGC